MDLIENLRKTMCNNLVIVLSAAYLTSAGCSRPSNDDLVFITKQTDLSEVQNAIGQYINDHRMPPPGGNSDLVKKLSGENDKNQLYMEFGKKRLKNGQWVDLWGHPFVYKGSLEWRLYSIGPNGIDEDGKGDDIQVKYP